MSEESNIGLSPNRLERGKFQSGAARVATEQCLSREVNHPVRSQTSGLNKTQFMHLTLTLRLFSTLLGLLHSPSGGLEEFPG